METKERPMTREEMVVMIQNYTDANGVLCGVEDLAKILLMEIEKANTKGYFRAMKDVREGTVARINSL
jgi:hypothetical protein